MMTLLEMCIRDRSIPIFKWGFSIHNRETGKKATLEEYDSIPKEERDKKYKVIPYLKIFNEWNIDKTNLEEVNKEKYDALLSKFEAKEIKDDNGMYSLSLIHILIIMKSVIKGITQPVLSMMLMIAITIFSTSCDNHEPIDRDIHVGYILCNDHSCMDTASYFNQTKRKAVGVVFAEKTDDQDVYKRQARYNTFFFKPLLSKRHTI